MRTEKWYQRRLSKYFDEHYAGYEETAGYYVDPAPNQWLFAVDELGIKVRLICDEKGNVTEKTTKKTKGS